MFGAVLLLIFIGCFAGAAAAALLLFAAHQLISRLFALTALGLFSTTAWAVVNLRLSRVPGHAARRVALSIAVFSLACLVACVIMAPSGDPGPDSGLSSVFRGKARFNKWSPAWLVSEGDQTRLGGFIMPFADKLIALKQEGNFRGAMTLRQDSDYIRTFNSIYGELEKRRDFMELGSALGEAYADTFLGRAPVGHMYVYIPSARPNRPLPVLVFMHGWLGNMKAYVWAWREFAEANGFAVLIPSWGNGIWDNAAGADMVRWIEQFIRKDARFDPNRVYVAGESNGGSGVNPVGALRVGLQGACLYCGYHGRRGGRRPVRLGGRETARANSVWRQRHAHSTGIRAGMLLPNESYGRECRNSPLSGRGPHNGDNGAAAPASGRPTCLDQKK